MAIDMDKNAYRFSYYTFGYFPEKILSTAGNRFQYQEKSGYTIDAVLYKLHDLHISTRSFGKFSKRYVHSAITIIELYMRIFFIVILEHFSE